MNVKMSEIPNQQKFFTEYWNLYKKYYEMWNEQNKDKLWELFLLEVGNVRSNYKNEEFFYFVCDMLQCLISEVTRKCEQVDLMFSKGEC